MNMRVGIGFDIHRLLHKEPLNLGGIRVPFDKGCVGHSDGDPLIHAIIDALLGAVGTKDIGEYFSDKNPKLRKVSSVTLLKRVREILEKKKVSIINIDSTVVCEKPRISLYKKEMIKKLASVLDIDVSQISVKGKTKEGLDSEGNGFSISAHAVALVSVPEKKKKKARG